MPMRYSGSALLLVALGLFSAPAVTGLTAQVDPGRAALTDHETVVDPSHPIFHQGRRVVVAERLRDGEQVTLDGRLDEPFWQRAVPASDFIMQEPTEGGVPTERTEVRIMFDRQNLYMGVTNFDSEPDRLMGNTMKRDDFLRADDRFMWTIDTFMDQASGYFFEMNPSGLMADAVMGPAGRQSMNREWDGNWDARAYQGDFGWSLEIVIPFRTINFDPNAPAWGINFQRTVRRKDEENLWSGHQRNQGLWLMSAAGLLVGVQDVDQGRGLDIRPYATAKISEAPGRLPFVGRATSHDVGLDIFYSLTPTLRTNLTVNTDFAETEVDQREVNLTRFPLRFPEKRIFFVEGGTFFDFTNAAPLSPFFSRSIGLDQATGTPQPIDGGVKVTGQAGAQDLGALYVRTAGGAEGTGEDFGVLRLRRRMMTQSYVGGLYTWRGGRGTAVDDRHTAGIDFRLATSSFRGRNNLSLSGWVVGVSDVLGTGDNVGFGAKLDYPNDRWVVALDVHEIQENLIPAVGFVRRRGYRGYVPSLMFSPRPDGHSLVRRLSFGASMDLATDLSNTTLTREVALTVGQIETHSADVLALTVHPTYERLKSDFPISQGVILPGGSEYEFTRFRVSLTTAARRLVAFNAAYSRGGFFSGDREERILGFFVRPRPGVTLNVSGEWNDVDLPEGTFQTRLYRFVADTQYNPRISLVNNLQYDTVSDLIGWQARFRWILRPGNDLFFVYQHNWFEPDPFEDDVGGFRTLDRRSAVKINYTLQL